MIITDQCLALLFNVILIFFNPDCYQSSWLMMIRLHEFQFGCCCCSGRKSALCGSGHWGGRQRIALARRLMSVPRWVSTPPLHVPLSQALAATHNMWIILTSQEPLNGLFRTSHHHLPATDPKFMAEKQLNFQARPEKMSNLLKHLAPWPPDGFLSWRVR